MTTDSYGWDLPCSARFLFLLASVFDRVEVEKCFQNRGYSSLKVDVNNQMMINRTGFAICPRCETTSHLCTIHPFFLRTKIFRLSGEHRSQLCIISRCSGISTRSVRHTITSVDACARTERTEYRACRCKRVTWVGDEVGKVEV